jgi:hypothetical protein
VTPVIWEEEPRRRVRPHLFTGDAWATLSERQREVIRLQRMSVVAALALDHQRRYHSPSHLIALTTELHEAPDALPNHDQR